MAEERDFHREAFEHGWEWFKYHADHRLILIRFYLILVGVTATAYIAGIVNMAPYASIGSAIFGFFFSIIFCFLDYRISNLVKLGETVLNKEQELLEKELNYTEIRIIKNAENNKIRILGSYKQIFRTIFIVISILFFIGGWIAYEKATTPQITAAHSE